MYPVSVSEVGVTTSHNYCSQILAPAWCGAILHSAVFVMVVRFSHIFFLVSFVALYYCLGYISS